LTLEFRFLTVSKRTVFATLFCPGTNFLPQLPY
jgi:hypothetical protein